MFRSVGSLYVTGMGSARHTCVSLCGMLKCDRHMYYETHMCFFCVILICDRHKYFFTQDVEYQARMCFSLLYFNM